MLWKDASQTVSANTCDGQFAAFTWSVDCSLVIQSNTNLDIAVRYIVGVIDIHNQSILTKGDCPRESGGPDLIS